jgi:TLP18.3/Psb32/MOLO-1 phosphatase superfamily protein
MVMDVGRILKHLVTPHSAIKRTFPPGVLKAIESATRSAEAGHRGEIRFAIEPGLDLWRLLRGETDRERAIEVFSILRVWDTEHNNGVLIYVLLADHDVEIVADRGIARHVQPTEWETICRAMRAAFKSGRFEEGAVNGIKAVGDLLRRHFPAHPGEPNELPDKPVVL